MARVVFPNPRVLIEVEKIVVQAKRREPGSKKRRLEKRIEERMEEGWTTESEEAPTEPGIGVVIENACCLRVKPIFQAIFQKLLPVEGEGPICYLGKGHACRPED